MTIGVFPLKLPCGEQNSAQSRNSCELPFEPGRKTPMFEGWPTSPRHTVGRKRTNRYPSPTTRSGHVLAGPQLISRKAARRLRAPPRSLGHHLQRRSGNTAAVATVNSQYDPGPGRGEGKTCSRRS